MNTEKALKLQEFARLFTLAYVRKSQGVKLSTERGTAPSWNGLPNRPSERTLRRQRLAALSQGIR